MLMDLGANDYNDSVRQIIFVPTEGAVDTDRRLKLFIYLNATQVTQVCVKTDMQGWALQRKFTLVEWTTKNVSSKAVCLTSQERTVVLKKFLHQGKFHEEAFHHPKIGKESLSAFLQHDGQFLMYWLRWLAYCAHTTKLPVLNRLHVSFAHPLTRCSYCMWALFKSSIQGMLL